MKIDVFGIQKDLSLFQLLEQEQAFLLQQGPQQLLLITRQGIATTKDERTEWGRNKMYFHQVGRFRQVHLNRDHRLCF